MPGEAVATRPRSLQRLGESRICSQAAASSALPIRSGSGACPEAMSWARRSERPSSRMSPGATAAYVSAVELGLVDAIDKLQRRGGDGLELVAPPANALRRQRQQRGDIAPDRNAAAASRSGSMCDAELLEPGRPGTKHGRCIGRTAAEPRPVGDDLAEPDAHRERRPGQGAQRLGCAHGEVAITGRNPRGCRSGHCQRHAIGRRAVPG